MSLDNGVLDSDERVRRKTCDIFVKTCDYMKFLIDEILDSNSIIPEATVIACNELTTKLLVLMNKLYQQQTPVKLSQPPAAVNVQKSLPEVSEKKFNEPSKSNSSSSVNDVFKNEPLNHNCDAKGLNSPADSSVEVRPQTKPIDDKLVNDKKDTKNSENNITVSEVFERINKVFIKNSIDDYSFFCLPCDVRTISDASWSKHLEKESHLAYTNKVCGKSVFISCERCKLILYGGKAKALIYYKYHNLHIHERVDSDTRSPEGDLSRAQSSTSLSSLKDAPGQGKEPCKSQDLSRSSSVSSMTSATASSKGVLAASQMGESSKASSQNLSRSSSISSLGKGNAQLQPVQPTPNPKKKKKAKATGAVAVNSPVNTPTPPVIPPEKAQPEAVKPPEKTQTVPAGPPLSALTAVINPPLSPPTVAVNSLPKPKPSVVKNSIQSKAAPVSKPQVKNSPAKPQSSTPVSASSANTEIDLTKSNEGFVDIINVMTNSINLHGVKLSAGFCIPCCEGFESAFAWYDHKVSNHQNPDGAKEKTCDKCEMKIYGTDQDIKKTFSNPFHLNLDALVQEMCL